MDDKIKTLRDALEWLDRRIRDEAELDGEMTNEHAIELAFIQSMLAKFPLRNCDVGTADDMIERLYGGETCPSCKSPQMTSDGCACVREGPCALRWAQTPYEAEEGGAK